MTTEASPAVRIPARTARRLVDNAVVSTWRRSVFALGWATGWGLQAAGRAVTYVAAGALTRETLRAAIARNWETFGLDESYILSGLMPWEQECYDRFLRPEDTILLVGCGTGRDLIALLRRGHHVEGLEPAGPALEIAQQMLDKLELRASLHRGAIEATELPRTYDVVISATCPSHAFESPSSRRPGPPSRQAGASSCRTCRRRDDARFRSA